MKTFLIGYALGLATWLVWNKRAVVFPWLRTEEQKVVDALAKKKG